jgi:nucleoside-diphosphate-sugar epimerase
MAKSPKIWLTGSTGFIGRPFLKVLKNAQFDVTCITQDAEKAKNSSNDNLLVHLDYMNTEDIKDKVARLGLPDIFIHLGWGDIAHPEFPIHLTEGVQSGKNLVETFFKLGLKKFIMTGSISQYGGRIGLLSEDMELEPQARLTNYAKAKNEVEKLGLEAANTYGKTFICVRIPWAFGAGQRQGSLINDLFAAHLKGTSVSLSPCEHYRDFIHMVDVVEGLKRICAVDESGIINLGSGKYVQVKDYVTEFWRKLGGDMDKLKFGARTLHPGEPDQPKSYFDLTRLKRLTQWQPALSLEEGIMKTIEDLYNEKSAGAIVT